MFYNFNKKQGKNFYPPVTARVKRSRFWPNKIVKKKRKKFIKKIRSIFRRSFASRKIKRVYGLRQHRRIRKFRKFFPAHRTWLPRRYFVKLKRFKKISLFTKKRRKDFITHTELLTGFKFPYRKKIWKGVARKRNRTLSFKYIKKFKFWIKKNFSAKYHPIFFRLFYLFRKTEISSYYSDRYFYKHFAKKLDPFFIQKYRNFAFRAFKAASPYYSKNFQRKPHIFKLSRKRFKRRMPFKFSYRAKNFTFLRTFEYNFKISKRFNYSKRFYKKNFKIFQISKSIFRSPLFTKQRSFFRFFKSSARQKNLNKFSTFQLYSAFRRRFGFFNSKNRIPRFLFTARRFNFLFPKHYFFARFSKKSLVSLKAFKRRKTKRFIFKNKFRKFRFSRRSKFKRFSKYYRNFNFKNKYSRTLAAKIRFFDKSLGAPIRSPTFVRRFFLGRPIYTKVSAYLGLFNRFGLKKFKLKSRRKKFFKYFGKFFYTGNRLISGNSKKFTKIFKKLRKVSFFLHIFRSVNNMFINVSAPRGRSLFLYSAGRTNFKGSKRLSPVAIETMGKTVSSFLQNSNINFVTVVFHSPINFLIRALLRGLKFGIAFSGFKYYMNRPHNGLRPRATRRV